MKFLLLSVLLALSTSASAQRTDTITLTYIVDGDTFYGTNTTGQKIKCRPIGFDTPEKPRGDRPGEPFYQEATDHLKSLIKIGDRIRLVYDVQIKDKYKRDLVYAYTMSGLFINAEMLLAGWAQTMTIPPNVRYADTFIELHREARKEGRGLWAQTIEN